MGGLLKNHKN